jgi:alpha-L-glutamate ligase-like protein
MIWSAWQNAWRSIWPNDSVLGINRRNLDYVFADYRPGRFTELDDKLLAKAKCEGAGVDVPRTIGTLRSQLELGQLRAWLVENDELVLKPARGWGGRGILVLARVGENFATPGGTVLSIGDIEDHARETLAGNFSLDEADDALLVEERIHPHEFLEELSPDGLSDLRIVLEKGLPLQAMLRVPTKESDGKANLHGGGLGLGIDIDTGNVTHAIQRDAPVHRHPDTGTQLVGVKVPLWPQCLELARHAAEIYSELDYIGVDIVLDASRGPLVLEVNARPGLAIQLANAAAQPVAPTASTPLAERMTFVVTWCVFGVLAFAPFLFQSWQKDRDEGQESIAVANLAQPILANPAPATDEVGTFEWSEAASDISSENEDFARARELAAAGKLEAAVVAYRSAATDSSIAPFALNNVGLLYRETGALEAAASALQEALRGHPEYARGHYNLGLVYRDQGDLVSAETEFRVALAQRPSYARAWNELGGLLARRETWDEAIHAIGQAIRFAPTLASYRKSLGHMQLQVGNPIAAAKAYRGALALDPDSRVAAEGWVRAKFVAAMSSGRPPAEATLDSMAALTERFDAQNQPLESRLLAAEVRWLSGGPSRARSIARDLVGSSDPVARRLALMCELELGVWTQRTATALAGDRSAIEIARLGHAMESSTSASEVVARFNSHTLEDPRIALLLLRLQGVNASSGLRTRALANCVSAAESRWVAMAASADAPLARADSLVQEPIPFLLNRSVGGEALPLPQSFLLWSTARIASFEQSDASTWFDALGRLNPGFRPGMLRNFASAVERGDATMARRIGLPLLADVSDPTEILLPLMRLELGRNRSSASRSLWRRLDRAAKKAPEAQILYAELLLAEDKPKNATKRLDKVLKQVPTHVEALFLRGKALAERRKRQDARASFETALDQEPNRADIRSALARVLMENRDYADAVKEWKRVLALYPNSQPDRSALFNLALSEQRSGESAAAVASWGRFLLVDPEDYRGYYNLALAQETLGRRDEAVTSFRKVLELNPDHVASRQRLTQLELGGSSP